MTSIRVVLVTAPRGEVAVSLARGLVEGGFAACVNIVPGVRSIYRWQGEICDEGEDLLIAKTTVDRFEALAGYVRSVHPYSVPEILSLPVEAGNDSYLEWVANIPESRPSNPSGVR